MNTAEAKVPNDEGNWQSIEIYLFSNGQQYSPPRKYHLRAEELNWWDATLNNLARSHYGIQHPLIYLYTTDGRLVEGPLELKDGMAYVAVEPPEEFIDAGYEKYLIRASRSWEKRQARKKYPACEHDQPCCLCPEKEGAATPETFRTTELKKPGSHYASSVHAKAPAPGTMPAEYEKSSGPRSGEYRSRKGEYGPQSGEIDPRMGQYEPRMAIPKSGEIGPPSGGYGPQVGEYVPKSSKYDPRGDEYRHRPGEYATRPGEYAPNLGEYAPRPDEYAPRPGKYAPRPGEFVPRLGKYSPRSGEYAPRPDEYESRGGEFGPDAREYRPKSSERGSRMDDEDTGRSVDQRARPGEYVSSPGKYRRVLGDQKAKPIDYGNKPHGSETRPGESIPWSSEIKPGIEISEIKSSDSETSVEGNGDRPKEDIFPSTEHKSSPGKYEAIPVECREKEPKSGERKGKFGTIKTRTGDKDTKPDENRPGSSSRGKPKITERASKPDKYNNRPDGQKRRSNGKKTASNLGDVAADGGSIGSDQEENANKSGSQGNLQRTGSVQATVVVNNRLLSDEDSSDEIMRELKGKGSAISVEKKTSKSSFIGDNSIPSSKKRSRTSDPEKNKDENAGKGGKKRKEYDLNGRGRDIDPDRIVNGGNEVQFGIRKPEQRDREDNEVRNSYDRNSAQEKTPKYVDQTEKGRDHRSRPEDQNGRELEHRRKSSDQTAKEFNHRSKPDEPKITEVDTRFRQRDQRNNGVRLSDERSKDVDYGGNLNDQRSRDNDHRGRSREQTGREAKRGSTPSDQKGKEVDRGGKVKEQRSKDVAHGGRPSEQRGKNEHGIRPGDLGPKLVDHDTRSGNTVSRVGEPSARAAGLARGSSGVRSSTPGARASSGGRSNPGARVSLGARADELGPRVDVSTRGGEGAPRLGETRIRASDYVNRFGEPGTLAGDLAASMVEPATRGIAASGAAGFPYISEAQQHVRRNSLSAGKPSTEKKRWSVGPYTPSFRRPVPVSVLPVPPRKSDDKKPVKSNREGPPKKLPGKAPVKTTASVEPGKSKLAPKYPYKRFTSPAVPPPTADFDRTVIKRTSTSLTKIISNHKSLATDSAPIENIISDREIIFVSGNLYKNPESEITSIRLDTAKQEEYIKDSSDETQVVISRQQSVTSIIVHEEVQTHTKQCKETVDEHVQGVSHCSNARVGCTGSCQRDNMVATDDPEENYISIINKGDVLNLKLNIEVRNGGRLSSCHKTCRRSRSLTNVTRMEKASQISIEDDMCVQSKSLQSLLNNECFRGSGFEGRPKVVVVQCACCGRPNNLPRCDPPPCCDSKKYFVLLPNSPQDDMDDRCNCEPPCQSYGQRRQAPRTNTCIPVKNTISDMSLETVRLKGLPTPRRDMEMYIATTNSMCQTEQQKSETLVTKHKVSITEDSNIRSEYQRHSSSQISVRTQAAYVMAKGSDNSRICPQACTQVVSPVCPQECYQAYPPHCLQEHPQVFPIVRPQTFVPVPIQPCDRGRSPDCPEGCSQTCPHARPPVILHPQLCQQVSDSHTQTEWCSVLLEARRHEDGRYSFHLPPLHVLRYYTF